MSGTNLLALWSVIDSDRENRHRTAKNRAQKLEKVWTHFIVLSIGLVSTLNICAQILVA